MNTLAATLEKSGALARAPHESGSVPARRPDFSSVFSVLDGESTMPPGLGLVGMLGLSCLAGAGIAVAAGVGMTWLQVRGGEYAATQPFYVVAATVGVYAV